MGGGGTISEGIRRLFQRRSSTTSTSKQQQQQHQHSNDNNNNNNINIDLVVRDLRSQLAVIPTTNDLDHDHDHQQSLFNLNHIKVPTNTVFFPSSMDPNKKVISSLFLYSLIHTFIGLDEFHRISLNTGSTRN